MKHETVTLVLITADRCVGVRHFHRADGEFLPPRDMTWVGDPNDEVSEAILELPNGDVVSMTGALWREIEEANREEELIRAAFDGRLNWRRVRQLTRAA